MSSSYSLIDLVQLAVKVVQVGRLVILGTRSGRTTAGFSTTRNPIQKETNFNLFAELNSAVRIYQGLSSGPISPSYPSSDVLDGVGVLSKKGAALSDGVESKHRCSSGTDDNINSNTNSMSGFMSEFFSSSFISAKSRPAYVALKEASDGVAWVNRSMRVIREEMRAAICSEFVGSLFEQWKNIKKRTNKQAEYPLESSKMALLNNNDQRSKDDNNYNFYHNQDNLESDFIRFAIGRRPTKKKLSSSEADNLSR
jgi:hypothetical protein